MTIPNKKIYEIFHLCLNGLRDDARLTQRQVKAIVSMVDHPEKNLLTEETYEGKEDAKNKAEGKTEETTTFPGVKIKNEEEKEWMRNCYRCGGIFKTKYRNGRVCPDCTKPHNTKNNKGNTHNLIKYKNELSFLKKATAL